jgi:hypothetical protein
MLETEAEITYVLCYPTNNFSTYVCDRLFFLTVFVCWSVQVLSFMLMR